VQEYKTRCEVFTEVNIQVEVFWVVTLCSAEVSQGRELWTSLPPYSTETLSSYRNTALHHKPEDTDMYMIQL